MKPILGPFFLALLLAAGIGAAGAQVAALTEAEKEWLKAHPVVTFALDEFNAPMNFRRKDAGAGSYSGASIDYMNLIARNTGLKLRFEGSTWPEALRKAMAHEVDGVMSARVREERKTRLAFSDPYLEIAVAMATPAAHANVKGLEDFRGERIAVVKNSVRVPLLRDRCPTCVLVEVDSIGEGMLRLRAGDADGYFDDLPVVQRAIEEAGTGERLKVALLYYYSEAGAVRFAIRNDAPELLAIVNKGIAAIRPEEHDLIRSRWLGSAKGASVQRDLSLTPRQRAWLAAHPVIRVGVDGDRRPLSWHGDDGRPQGIAIDFLRRIEATIGRPFELVVNVPRSGNVLPRERADVFVARSASAAREENWRFTTPFASTPVAVFAPAGTSPLLGGMRGLAGKRIAVLRASPAEETMRREVPQAVIRPVGDLVEAIGALRRGEADVYVGALLATTQQLTDSGESDIRVVGETGIDYHFAMAVRKDWPELAEIIDLAMAAIPASERDAIRGKWAGLAVDPRIDYRPVGALLLIVLLAIAFIIQLRRMVRARTSELEREVAARRANEVELRAEIAERKRAEATRASLEAQLRESQKMEAIGTLAGGVAHDFNNIIATILGNAELAREDSRNNAPALQSLGEIQKAATRGRDLVRQILSFSRRQPLARKHMALTPVVEESARLLRATLPARVNLDVQCAAGLPAVMADATQIEQIVINLATNASHAMEGAPGRIEIRLDLEEPPSAQVLANPALQALVGKHPGRVVRLMVRDSGSGMDGATLGRIWEPFFTTKPLHEGTGLGLPVVHGIVQGHEGAIVVESEVGRGTTFTLYFPPAPAPAAADVQPEVAPAPPPAAVTGGGEHILYLDDDEPLTWLMTRILERRGYRVSGFVDQRKALEALRADPASFDLVVTDYNMPGMSGLEVAAEVRTIRADLPVAVASGFVDEALRTRSEGAGVCDVIFKATEVEDFGATVMRLMRSRGQPAGNSLP